MTHSCDPSSASYDTVQTEPTPQRVEEVSPDIACLERLVHFNTVADRLICLRCDVRQRRDVMVFDGGNCVVNDLGQIAKAGLATILIDDNTVKARRGVLDVIQHASVRLKQQFANTSSGVCGLHIAAPITRRGDDPVAILQDAT